MARSGTALLFYIIISEKGYELQKQRLHYQNTEEMYLHSLTPHYTMLKLFNTVMDKKFT
jgi:hypothetical protein